MSVRMFCNSLPKLTTTLIFKGSEKTSGVGGYRVQGEMEGGDVGKEERGETRMKRRKGGWETGKAGKGRMERGGGGEQQQKGERKMKEKRRYKFDLLHPQIIFSINPHMSTLKTNVRVGNTPAILV